MRLCVRSKLNSPMLFILIGSDILSVGRNKIGDTPLLTCKWVRECEYPRAPCSIIGLSIKHTAIYKNCLFSTQLIQRSLKLATHTVELSASNAISITFHNSNPVNTNTRAHSQWRSARVASFILFCGQNFVINIRTNFFALLRIPLALVIFY